MKIVIDSAIPYVKGVFEPYFQVVYKSGDSITSGDIENCDAMIIRTRTICNRELLAGSMVRIIASATIGVDHIDTDYCLQHDIAVVNATGCNSRAVAQWVLAAVMEDDRQTPIVPTQTTIGVVGVGSVGSVVADIFDNMGFNVLRNDPPRAERDREFISMSLDTLLSKSDYVTFHTPLTHYGMWATENLLGSHNISLLKNSSVVINSSRGGVVQQSALVDSLKECRVKAAYIDVWEGEPNIDRELLRLSRIATPHIAGYSLQGKAKGSEMVVRQIAQFFDIFNLRTWSPQGVESTANTEISWANLKRLMKLYYDINSDSDALKLLPQHFESQRNNYSYRSEFF